MNEKFIKNISIKMFLLLSALLSSNLRAGDVFAVATGGPKVIFYDVETGKRKHYFTFKNGVESLAWHPNARFLCVGTDKSEVVIFDWLKRKIIKRFDMGDRWLNSVEWSPDGRYLAASAKRKGDYGVFEIWNVVNEDPKKWVSIKQFEGAFSISWSFKGRHLFLGSGSGEIKVFDAKNNFKSIITLKGCNNWLPSMTLSSDGKYLVAGTLNQMIIWNVSNADPQKWNIVKVLNEHEDVIKSVAWNNKNTYFASASYKEVKIWNIKNLKCIKSFDEQFSPIVAWSPDGQYFILTTSNAIQVWDAKDFKLKISIAKEKRQLYEFFTSLVFKPSEKQVIKWLQQKEKGESLEKQDLKERVEYLKEEMNERIPDVKKELMKTKVRISETWKK